MMGAGRNLDAPMGPSSHSPLSRACAAIWGRIGSPWGERWGAHRMYRRVRTAGELQSNVKRMKSAAARRIVAFAVLVNCTPMSGGARPAGALDEPERRECGDHATQLALGYHHSCALLESGRVACWGDNSMGQLGTGRGTPSHSFAPIVVPSLNGVVEMRANGFTTCVRRRAGDVSC
jgi:hypothetical protein